MGRVGVEADIYPAVRRNDMMEAYLLSPLFGDAGHVTHAFTPIGTATQAAPQIRQAPAKKSLDLHVLLSLQSALPWTSRLILQYRDCPYYDLSAWRTAVDSMRQDGGAQAKSSSKYNDNIRNRSANRLLPPLHPI